MINTINDFYDFIFQINMYMYVLYMCVYPHTFNKKNKINYIK